MNLSDTKMARNRVEWNPLRYNKFELVRVLNWGRPQSTESKRRFLVAPHRGRVSNFHGLSAAGRPGSFPTDSDAYGSVISSENFQRNLPSAVRRDDYRNTPLTRQKRY